MRCSRIASPAARTCWPPSGSRPRWRPRASRCCGSISPASAPARAISPTRPSPPTSPIWCGPPIICAKPARRPAILIGHSLGGAAILAAAGQIPDAKAVVTIAAPSDPAHVTHLFKDRIEDIRTARQGRGPARRPAVSHHQRIPRRHRRAQPDGARGQAAQGAADHAFADRRHRRHRQRHANLRRRQTSQELCLAGGRRPSALRQARRRLCRRRHRRLGRALCRSRFARAARRFRQRAAQGRGAARPATANSSRRSRSGRIAGGRRARRRRRRRQRTRTL